MQDKLDVKSFAKRNLSIMLESASNTVKTTLEVCKNAGIDTDALLDEVMTPEICKRLSVEKMRPIKKQKKNNDYVEEKLSSKYSYFVCAAKDLGVTTYKNVDSFCDEDINEMPFVIAGRLTSYDPTIDLTAISRMFWVDEFGFCKIVRLFETKKEAQQTLKKMEKELHVQLKRRLPSVIPISTVDFAVFSKKKLEASTTFKDIEILDDGSYVLVMCKGPYDDDSYDSTWKGSFFSRTKGTCLLISIFKTKTAALEACGQHIKNHNMKVVQETCKIVFSPNAVSSALKKALLFWLADAPDNSLPASWPVINSNVIIDVETEKWLREQLNIFYYEYRMSENTDYFRFKGVTIRLFDTMYRRLFRECDDSYSRAEKAFSHVFFKV